jgi:hypothetical protein
MMLVMPNMMLLFVHFVAHIVAGFVLSIYCLLVSHCYLCMSVGLIEEVLICYLVLPRWLELVRVEGICIDSELIKHAGSLNEV